MMIYLLFVFFALPGVHSLTCPFGWFTFGGQCLKYLGYRSFTDGVTLCRQFGGRMLEPRSEGSSNLISRLSTRDIWLGINNNRYESDGELIVYRRIQYTSGYAFSRGSYWFSAECPDETKLVYCELPSFNTACGSPSTLFIEDSFPSPSLEACQDACQSVHGCTFWTYTNTSKSNCGLRFYETRDIAGGGLPTARTGFPYFIIPTPARVFVGRLKKDVYSAAACQKLCSEDPKCITFTWTNYDYTFGGVNSNTCIFNYGKPLRTLTLPYSSASINIISGPPCCYEKSACERPTRVDVGVSVSTGHISLNHDELTKLQKEQDDFVRKTMIDIDNDSSNTTEGPTVGEFLNLKPKKGGGTKKGNDDKAEKNN